MRKVLLATTAMIGVAFAGAAHAAAPASPISLNVGGYNDFVAGLYHESEGTAPVVAGTGLNNRTNHDFEDEFKLNFDALGKGSNGIEYGANLSLWNGPEAGNLWEGGNNGVAVNSAYVWMSGAFGKVLFGDEHGASDLFVYAPTVGEGQVDGRYRDFVDTTTLAYFQPSGIDNTEHSTKITYYTPKVGNDMNKVQLGVSYMPNMYNYGQDVVKYNNTTPAVGTGTTTNGVSPYSDVVKGAVQYTGNFHPVNVTLSGQIINGFASHGPASTTILNGGLVGTGLAGQGAQDFTSWGLGGQVGFAGFTVGASYTDLGSYNTVHNQNKSQDVATIGGKYEFDKVGVAASWLTGEGYANYIPGNVAQNGTDTNYVSSFNAWSVGAVYTWFPGLSSNVDGVLFRQSDDSVTDHNNGYVVLVSQRLAF